MNKIFWLPAKNNKDYIWRYEGNPLLRREEIEGYQHVCNSAFVFENGVYHAVFRMEDKGACPHLMTGTSKDGIHFKIGKNIDFRLKNGKKFEYYYASDPRYVKIGNAYYLVFCADKNGANPSIYIAETKDFNNFIVLPTGFLPYNRNGVLFPEKINGEYVMLSRPSDEGDTPFGDIYISFSKDLVYWGKHQLLIKRFDTKYNFWERIKIGPGPSPIKTKEGWLVIYHGVNGTCNGWVYSLSVALLDLKDPTKVLYKAKQYLLTPEETYERVGFVNNVIFPTAAITDKDGHITIYYGSADTYVGVAFTTVDKLLEFVKKHN